MTQLDLIPDPEREALAARIRRAIPEQVRKANARDARLAKAAAASGVPAQQRGSVWGYLEATTAHLEPVNV